MSRVPASPSVTSWVAVLRRNTVAGIVHRVRKTAAISFSRRDLPPGVAPEFSPKSNESRFFSISLGDLVGVRSRDDLGIIKRVGELAADNGVSIHAILQNPIEDVANVDFVVTTDPCK